MGNIISNDKANLNLQLSNGSTAVLLSTLLLSGSDLAISEWEKQLVIWLAEKDQSLFGLGIVSFDIGDIGWHQSDFHSQKDFLLRIVDLALQKHRWEILDYDPPFVQAQLENFRHLVAEFSVEFVGVDQTWQWWLETNQYEKCAVHDVYLHEFGCAICNDG